MAKKAKASYSSMTQERKNLIITKNLIARQRKVGVGSICYTNNVTIPIYEKVNRIGAILATVNGVSIPREKYLEIVKIIDG